MKYRIIIEQDEDGMFTVECPSLPGCISQGKSQEEALKNIKEAVKLHIRTLAEDGLPLFESKGVKERLVEVHV